MRKILLALVVLLGLVSAAAAQATFDCSGGFATTGACGLNLTWEYKNTPFKITGADSVKPKLEGSSLILYPTGTNHHVANLIYQTPVNVQKFTTNFSFVPNGLFLALNWNNGTATPGYQGKDFSAGAGCEAGFFQGYGQGSLPNHVFALDFDNYDPLLPYQNAPWDFAHNSVQIYQSNLPPSEYPNTSIQCPCIGGSTICGDNTNPNVGDHQIAKISTDPVSMNYPVNQGHTTTGDTYSATATYDGSNFKLDLFDLTDGDSCPGAKCFTHTWTTDIPHSVNGNTAWVGLVATSGSYDSAHPLLIKSWTYSAGGSGPVPTPTNTTAPTPVPTSTATPAPIAGNCSFTSPLGSVTWACSPK